MLARCVMNTSTAISAQAMTAGSGVPVVVSSGVVGAGAALCVAVFHGKIKIALIGKVLAAIKLERLTMRESFMHAIHTASAMSIGNVSTGHMATSAPKPVATPLPPLNLSHGEKICPAIAAMAMTIHTVNAFGEMVLTGRPSTPLICPVINTGSAPLSASSAKHMKPHLRPSARPTLVAPTLPLPTARKFTPFDLAINTPKGMLPHTKAATTSMMTCKSICVFICMAKNSISERVVFCAAIVCECV